MSKAHPTLSAELLILKFLSTPSPTAIYGASLLLRHLDALVAEITGVRAAEDIEYIHRMRVASRRLRNALPIFQSALPFRKMKPWGQEIQRITRSLGAARDLDVQLDSLYKFLKSIHSTSQFVPGIRRLILRLEQQRAGLQIGVIQALDHFEQSNIALEMHHKLDPLALQQNNTLPPHADLYHHANEIISNRLVDFFQREIAIRDPENITELHAQRITAKHLRYTLELFSSLYSNELKPYLNTCRKFQDQLGLLHDCDVWIALLPEFMATEKQRTVDYYGRPDPYNLLVPGLMEFQANRMALRKSQFVEFLEDWDSTISKGLWEQLRTQITNPLISSNVLPTIQYPSPSDPPQNDSTLAHSDI
jgi:CHAD domain-containing protein